jgi:hypothetical protein
LAQRQRDCGGNGQNKDERTFELTQEETKRAQPWRIFNAVGACNGKLYLRLFGGKPNRPSSTG